MLHLRFLAASLLTACLALPSMAAAQLPGPTFQAVAIGNAVSASWTAVAGATGYRVEAGVTAGIVLAGYEVGPTTTSFTLPAVPQGTYYMRVRARSAAGLGPVSNGVAVTVNSGAVRPAAPTNFSASVAGSTVTLNAQLPSGPITGLLVAIGVTPGAVHAMVPVPVSSQAVIPNVPQGVYFARLIALNAGGQSTPSNEVQIVVNGSCAPPAVPTVSARAEGQAVLVNWSAVPGAVAYRLDVAATPGGAAMLSQPLGGSTTSLSNPYVTPGTYYVRVTAANACGLTATSADAILAVTAAPGGYRTPNPPGPTPPNYLPLPNRGAVVAEMARQYPNEFRNSCVEHGGNNRFLYLLVQRLRQEDTRWGLNWKRARVGDMSQDVVNYNFGSDPDEGTHNTYVIDVIGNHCGNGNPTPTWNNVTVMFTTGARWTLQPYLAAGYR